MIETPITRISGPVGNQNNGKTQYELGSLFKNVYLGTDEKDPNKMINYTLEDLYNELKEYFNNNSFISYSKNEPTAQQIKVWYQTENE